MLLEILALNSRSPDYIKVVVRRSGHPCKFKRTVMPVPKDEILKNELRIVKKIINLIKILNYLKVNVCLALLLFNRRPTTIYL